MPLIYDRVIFAKWRALAITDLSALKPGTTYHSNNGDVITLLGFLSKNDWLSRIGQPADLIDEERFIAVDTNGKMRNLRDLNVGASYNPWLLFTEEATARACRVHLNVTVTSLGETEC